MVAEIKKHLLSGRAIYADETGGREDWINGYHWSFSNDKVQLLLYRKSRSAKVVRQVFGKEGKDFEGVLVTDFYSAYNEYFGPHQRCWVHYKKDMKKLKKDHPKDRKLNSNKEKNLLWNKIGKGFRNTIDSRLTLRYLETPKFKSF